MPFATAEFAASQSQVAAQQREETIARLTIDLVRTAVDAQRVLHERMITPLFADRSLL
jgi:hypothetical protein